MARRTRLVDLYDDSVNIVTRLKTSAEAGEILVSGTVYDHVRNKVKAAFEDLARRNPRVTSGDPGDIGETTLDKEHCPADLGKTAG